MRVTVQIDSATPEEVYDLTLAFQRTRHSYEVPSQITTEPTVTVAGVAMGWASPAILSEHALALLTEFDALQDHRSIVALLRVPS